MCTPLYHVLLLLQYEYDTKTRGHRTVAAARVAGVLRWRVRVHAAHLACVCAVLRRYYRR